MLLKVLLGDCVERLSLLPEESVGGVCVCDPPYG